MNYLKSFLSDIKKRPSLYLFLYLIIFTFDRHHRLEYDMGDRGPFYYDAFEYYRILPDFFINGGKTDHAFYKTTMGMAIMYSPGFFVGNVIAHYNHLETNGYSESYQWAVRWVSLLYTLIGLWFCRKSLLLFFNEWATLITLLVTLFGTNLFFYSYGWGELPHNYLFCLNAIFIFLSLRWGLYRRRNLLPCLCLVGGLITLIRPIGVSVFLFPLLAGVTSADDFMARIKYIFDRPFLLVVSVLLFCVPIAAQMIFWKIHINKFVYWSYLGERFFFNDPQLVNFLFSYRKGWLVYTPVMTFAVLGFIPLFRQARKLFYPVIILFLLNVYLLSCWWEWSFGGSFGCRALIEYYAFLAFPFAAFICWIQQMEIKNILKKVAFICVLLIIAFFIRLNIYQTALYRQSVIHWSGMNKETYWYIMTRDSITKKDYEYLQDRFTPPDQSKMLKGERDH